MGCSSCAQLPVDACSGRQQQWLKRLDSCYSGGRPGLNSCLLVSARPNVAFVGDLEENWLVGALSFSLPLFFKNKLKIIFKKTNIPAWKHRRIPSNKISRDRKGCQQPAFLLLIDEQTGTRGSSGQCASGRLGQCGAV